MGTTFLQEYPDSWPNGRVEAMDGCVEIKMGVGSNGPHHRVASVEGVEHGVSHGGGDVVGHTACWATRHVGHSGGDVAGPEGHAIGHWETGVAHGAGRDHAGHNGHGVESSPGMDSIHLNLHGLCLPLGHPMDVLDGGLRMDPLHHMLHLSILGNVGGVMHSCRNGRHVMG